MRLLPILAALLIAPAALADAAGDVVASAATPPAPLPPGVPASWTVRADRLLAERGLDGLASRLGARPAAARNTIFDVGAGAGLQVDVLVAATSEDAAVMEQRLLAARPAGLVARRGRVLVDAVAPPDLEAIARAGMESIAQALACDPAAR